MERTQSRTKTLSPVRGGANAKLVILRRNDDPDERHYTVNYRIGNFGKPFSIDRTESSPKHISKPKYGLTLEIVNLIYELWRIEGIESISIEAYKLVIIKGSAFHWNKNQIDRRVVKAICQHFFAGDLPKKNIERRQVA